MFFKALLQACDSPATQCPPSLVSSAARLVRLQGDFIDTIDALDTDEDTDDETAALGVEVVAAAKELDERMRAAPNKSASSVPSLAPVGSPFRSASSGSGRGGGGGDVEVVRLLGMLLHAVRALVTVQAVAVSTLFACESHS